jgi:hypothetical protein
MKATQLWDQMELGFGAVGPARYLRRRAGRGTTRAQWWFTRMHQMVDAACGWVPAAASAVKPLPRPEQTYLALAPKR